VAKDRGFCGFCGKEETEKKILGDPFDRLWEARYKYDSPAGDRKQVVVPSLVGLIF